MEPITAFNLYAKDSDTLSVAACELGLIAVLGKVPTSFARLIRDHSSGINKQTFLTFCNQNKPDPLTFIRELFTSLDVKGTGYVSREDLELVFNDVAPHLGHNLLSSVFQEFDEDRDGRISFRDFQRAFKLANDND
ncbi:hypothetical protein RCL1_006119 [Eukaryota sp. TZLM3-RCL]